MAPQSSRSLPHSCDQRSVSGPPVNLNVAVNGVLSLSSTSASRASTSTSTSDDADGALQVGRAADGGTVSTQCSTCTSSLSTQLPFATPESGKHGFRSEDDKEGTRNQHATSDKSNSDSNSHSTISNTSNYPKVDTEPQPAHPTSVAGSPGQAKVHLDSYRISPYLSLAQLGISQAA